MDFLRGWHIVAIFLLAALAACTQQQQSPQEIREKTAEATAEAKSDAKAVAEGIREVRAHADRGAFDRVKNARELPLPR